MFLADPDPAFERGPGPAALRRPERAGKNTDIACSDFSWGRFLSCLLFAVVGASKRSATNLKIDSGNKSEGWLAEQAGGPFSCFLCSVPFCCAKQLSGHPAIRKIAFSETLN